MPAGVHGVSNGAPSFVEGRPWPKVVKMMTALGCWVKQPGAAEAACTPLLVALADDASVAEAALPDTGVGQAMERLLAPVFVRGLRYGTRASSVVRVSAAGAVVFCERRFAANGVPAGETRLELPPA